MNKAHLNNKIKELVSDKLAETPIVQHQLLKGGTLHITTISRFQPHLKLYKNNEAFDIAIKGHISPREGPCQIAEILVDATVLVDETTKDVCDVTVTNTIISM